MDDGCSPIDALRVSNDAVFGVGTDAKNTAISIRPFKLDDIDAVSSLDMTTFADESYPKLFLRQAFDLWPTLFPVADVSGGAIGGFGIGALSENPRTAWILALAVAPSLRRHGIGRALTENLLCAMSALEVNNVYLTTKPTNTAAINVFERLGFRVVNYDGAYFGVDNPRYVMTLNKSSSEPETRIARR